MIKKIVTGVVLVIIIGVSVYGYLVNQKFISPLGTKKETVVLNLAKYDFDSLRKRGGEASVINIEGEPEGVNLRRKGKINFESKVISYLSEGKRITGMMNYVVGEKRPVVIMIRGYADKPGYYSGSGTWRVADELAKNGFVTVSMDFLGFAGSDPESVDMLEARFEKVTAVLDLIESVKKLSHIDSNRISIWAHSNGGQIALSVLEITG